MLLPFCEKNAVVNCNVRQNQNLMNCLDTEFQNIVTSTLEKNDQHLLGCDSVNDWERVSCKTILKI